MFLDVWTAVAVEQMTSSPRFARGGANEQPQSLQAKKDNSFMYALDANKFDKSIASYLSSRTKSHYALTWFIQCDILFEEITRP